MRNEKQLLLDEIESQIESHDAFVMIQHEGLDANTVSGFRDSIAEMGGNVEFVKKRIFIKAALEKGIEFELSELPGHIALVFAGNDAVQATKAVFDLKKQADQKITVIGGHFDGKKVGANEVETLSKLPSKPVMQAQLLALFEAPLSQTLATIDALLMAVPYCLENKSKEGTPNAG